LKGSQSIFRGRLQPDAKRHVQRALLPKAQADTQNRPESVDVFAKKWLSDLNEKFHKTYTNPNSAI
jgi:hypothetical protein